MVLFKGSRPSNRSPIRGGLDTDPRVLLLENLIAKRALPGEALDAKIRWGAPSSFNADLLQPDNISFTLENPSDDTETPEQDTLVFTEVSRNTETVRITNPVDPDDWVDVERIKDITFDGPDGRFRKFVLKN